MLGLKIGYARVSNQAQDLTAQRNAVSALGVTPDRVYVDHGLTGTARVRPGLRPGLGGSVHDPTDRSAGCCPTCWPWSPSSSPTSSRCARERAWPSPEP
jgi:hypothetical protein